MPRAKRFRLEIGHCPGFFRFFRFFSGFLDYECSALGRISSELFLDTLHSMTSKKIRFMGAALSLSCLAACDRAPEQSPLLPNEATAAVRGEIDEMLAPVIDTWTGDLPAMRERRLLRVLVSFSPTRFTIVKGERKGFEAEMMARFDEFLNEKTPRADQLEVVYLPVPFDELIPSLLAGRGDLVAAGMTITPERSRKVSFSNPYHTDVSEVVVTHGSLDELSSVDDLAGRKVHVVQGSSWAESLRRLNGRLENEGKAGIEIVQMDSYLEVHDVIDLVNAGILDITVADRHEAKLWAEVLPNIEVREDLEVASGLYLAWATRPDSPKLIEALDEFGRSHQKGTLMGNMLFKRYYGNTKLLENPLSGEEMARMDRLRPLFVEFGEQYEMPWLMLVAQGFQESGLDQSKESHAGAVGVMQIKPATAAGKEVGIPDISTERNNIHAGVKYLAHLRDTYVNEPELEPLPRLHLTLASYNAGPSRIKALRAETARRGLDPNLWFFNVERVVLENVGREPVQYVANIHKYYVAYRLALEVQTRRNDAKSGV